MKSIIETLSLDEATQFYNALYWYIVIFGADTMKQSAVGKIIGDFVASNETMSQKTFQAHHSSFSILDGTSTDIVRVWTVLGHSDVKLLLGLCCFDPLQCYKLESILLDSRLYTDIHGQVTVLNAADYCTNPFAGLMCMVCKCCVLSWKRQKKDLVGSVKNGITQHLMSKSHQKVL
jgi:hypothetical protein